MPIEKLGIKLYSLKEAAEVLGVSYATIKTYHQNNRFNGQRIGRSIMVTETELRRFIEGDGGSNGSESK